MNTIISATGDFLQRNSLTIQIIAAVISVFLLWRIIFYALNSAKIIEPTRDFLDYTGLADKFVKKRTNKIWAQIMRRLQEGGQNNLKLAVAEADYVLDVILRNARYPGKSLDERLQKTASAQIPNLEDIRGAHAVRNKIFSDPSFVIEKKDAEQSVNVYKKLFEEWGFLN